MAELIDDKEQARPHLQRMEGGGEIGRLQEALTRLQTPARLKSDQVIAPLLFPSS